MAQQSPDWLSRGLLLAPLVFVANFLDGGITIQGFLRAGLIQRLVITRVPLLLGEGVPLFGTLPRDMRLRHVATRHYPSGLVQSEYHVAD